MEIFVLDHSPENVLVCTRKVYYGYFFGLHLAISTKGYSHEVKLVFDDVGEDNVFLKKLK